MVQTESAIKLVTELKQNRLLPKYNEEAMRQIQKEVKQTYTQLLEKLSDKDFEADEDKNVGQTIVSNAIVQRNLRCSLAYLTTRMDRLQKIAWEAGKTLPKHIQENLSPAEIQFYKQYLEQVDAMNRSIAQGSGIQLLGDLDLTTDMEPPKELFLEVRIKKDYGAVMLPESGEVHLQKNTTHLLRRSEVDHLIKQGVVAEVV